MLGNVGMLLHWKVKAIKYLLVVSLTEPVTPLAEPVQVAIKV